MKKLQRYDAVWPNEQDDGWCVSYEDVQELEAQYAAVCEHMMSMYYALCDILVPDPEDDPEDVILRAKRVIERFQNDELQTVMVELPDTEEEQDND